MLNKRYDVELKAAGDKDPEGTVIAYASVFGTVDLVGDRVIKGAFTKSLRKWRESGDPIPMILDHQWGDVHAHIGVAHPSDVKQTTHGLLGKGMLDIKDNPVAAQTYKLLKRRSLKAFSFGYRVLEEDLDEEGVNNLLELDLIEFGPTLKGAHPDAQLVGVKSAVEATMVKNADLRQRTEEAALELAMGGRKRNIHAARKANDPGFIEELADAMMGRFADLGVLSEDAVKAVWSTAYVNDLPDSAFLYIAPGGEKDEDGKTTPRSLRYFPVRDKTGKVDLPHVRNALARIPQSNCPDAAKEKATAAAERLLREHDDSEKRDDGIEPDDEEVKLGTGKRDDELRRQTEAVVLDLAMGRDPKPMPKGNMRMPEVEDGGKPGDPASKNDGGVVINFDGDFVNMISDVVATKIKSESTDADDDDDQMDDTGDKEDPPKPSERELRKATREVALELALGGSKQLASELSQDLRELGTVRFGGDRTYVFVDDYDVDENWVVFCIGGPDEAERYVKMGYTRGEDGLALTGDEVAVERTTDYRSKGKPPEEKALTPDDYAEAVLKRLEAARAEEEDDDEQAKGRDPLRKQTELEALDLALGRSAKKVPTVAQPPKEKDEKPDEPKPATPEDYADAIVNKLEERVKKAPEDDETDESKPKGRDPLRKRTDREALELALGRPVKRVPEAAKSGDEKDDDKKVPDPEVYADAVVKRLEERKEKEVEKPNDEKDESSKSGGRDPLRKRTEAQALEFALGRSPRAVPDIAQPEPESEPREVPDEKVLRRQTNETALDLALGGFS